MISTLLKESKNYCDNYFKDKVNDMKNTWKRNQVHDFSPECN